MQILIDLHASDEGVIHAGKEDQRRWLVDRLYQLLTALEGKGYKIHSLYGNFVFDVAKREAIDAGEPGEDVPADIRFAQAVIASGGKMAVVFFEEKYIVFADRFFLAIHFSQGRRERPISIDKAIRCFDDLFVKGSLTTLRSLYARQFEEFSKEGAKLLKTL